MGCNVIPSLWVFHIWLQQMFLQLSQIYEVYLLARNSIIFYGTHNCQLLEAIASIVVTISLTHSLSKWIRNFFSLGCLTNLRWSTVSIISKIFPKKQAEEGRMFLCFQVYVLFEHPEILLFLFAYSYFLFLFSFILFLFSFILYIWIKISFHLFVFFLLYESSLFHLLQNFNTQVCQAVAKWVEIFQLI